MKYKKVFLIILDGLGLGPKNPGNAILKAGMPYLDSLIGKYPSFGLVSAGLVVGLPWGSKGNSEVGHSSMGSGRVLVQNWARINKDIRGGEFFQNPALLKAVNYAKTNNSALHFAGSVSAGGVHSHEDHLITLLDLAKQNGVERIGVHMFTDGIDTGPNEGIISLKKVSPYIKKAGAKLSSIAGRMYAMDRVENWELTESVWKIMMGNGNKIENAEKYLKESYKAGKRDHEIEPACLGDGLPIQQNDAVIFFNYRNDRMIQPVSPFAFKDFSSFAREPNPANIHTTTMTLYKEEFGLDVAYTPLDIENTIGEIISNNKLKQWRITETEKEAHVTGFFNGGKMDPWPGEQRFIVPSIKMKGDEYIKHPEMRLDKVVEKILKVKDDDSSLYITNFANPDMIGHTGDIDAGVKAIQITDLTLKNLIPQLIASPDNAVIITADHGNIEEMIDPETGEKDTQHSTNNVPMIFVGQGLELLGAGEKNLEALSAEAPFGSVIDVASSILALLDVKKPKEMVGNSLISI